LQVLIDVHYCALNISDSLLSRNLYTFEPKLPIILGYEVVGKLVELGAEAEKRGYKVGDKVIALNKERYGGLAEKCLAEIGVRTFTTLDVSIHACILMIMLLMILLFRTYGNYLL